MDAALKTARFLRIRKISRLLQPTLADGKDLAGLPGLDPKLWVALASPAKGLEFDERTLELLDGDGDGRIRRRDVVTAVEWTLSLVKHPSVLDDPSPRIALDQLDTSKADGERVRASAVRVLKNLDKRDAKEITLEDALSGTAILAAARSNGDGVIAMSTARDDEERAALTDVMACVGSVKDRSGADGIGTVQITQFWKELADFAGWLDAGKDPTQALAGEVGGAAEAAWAAYAAVHDKVADWFAHAAVARFDPAAAEALNKPLRDWAGMVGKSAADLRTALRDLPLALVTPEMRLPLADGVNPAWEAEMAAFRDKVATAFAGPNAESLSVSQWADVQASLEPYGKWLASKPATKVSTLGEDRVRALLAGDLRARLEALVDRDLSLAAEIDGVALVEKLLRFKRDLLRFANNFAAFPYFYDVRSRSIFQTGTLYLDARALQLCVTVADVAKHAALAEKGGIFLIYCALTRGKETRNIAAAVTAGASTRIFPGRNGVFYDRQGREWDATVTKVIQAPISLKEAALAPFVRLGGLVGSQFEKMSSAREAALNKSVSDELTAANKAVPTAPPALAPAKPAPAPESPADRRAGMGGLLAGGGLAVAALSTSVAYLTSTLAKVQPIYLLYTVLFFVAIISIPSVILAWLKLRRRDVGMVLEAGGWAINGQIPLNRQLGRSLTEVVPGGMRFSGGNAPVDGAAAPEGRQDTPPAVK